MSNEVKLKSVVKEINALCAEASATMRRQIEIMKRLNELYKEYNALEMEDKETTALFLANLNGESL